MNFPEKHVIVVDIVLIDIMMPEMDGYETIRKVSGMNQFKNLPIIALKVTQTEAQQLTLLIQSSDSGLVIADNISITDTGAVGIAHRSISVGIFYNMLIYFRIQKIIKKN